MTNSINDKFFEHEIVKDTQALRDELDKHVEEFLAKGGHIKQVNSGIRSVDLNDFNNVGKKAANDKRKRGSANGAKTARENAAIRNKSK